ncbi:unnamed protein product [Paramecium pentaurelia]|uniref:Transmembrane protein n=1 Tax=Paramecium pentaurelia TaxID=43138 RepID=A0A8S1WTX1_9CILI|nr:unnamed protein product [Paramecium pentaurelia]
MNVADRGMHIILMYLRMNAYTILSIQMLTKVNQICSNDGEQFLSVSIKGASFMIILNLTAFIYVKAKEKMQVSDNFLLAFLNICWGIIEFMKSYQTTEININECQYVINIQQITFYFQATTALWVVLAFFFSQIVIRITSLPINCVSIYLILVNEKQSCLEDNIYYLMIFSTVWLIILGIPYNFFMSANKRVAGPYQFLTTIGILIQIPVCVLIYLQGLNYKNDACQTAYTAQEIYMVISVLQLVILLLYFIYYKKYEKERKNQEISKELVNLSTTTVSTKLSSTKYTIKK